jgi:small ligand-binding sensory domain FIST
MDGRANPRYGAAISSHPAPAEAIGEVIGQVLDSVGARPDLAVLFATAPYTGLLEDLAAAVQTALDPRALVGTTAAGVLGSGIGVEDQPALALWAGRLAGSAAPVHLPGAHDGDDASEVAEAGCARLRDLAGDPAGAAGLTEGSRPSTVLLLADPFSFPVEDVLGGLARHVPGLRAVGGLASAGDRPGGNRLVIGGRVVTDGAVAVLLGGDAAPATAVSHACRPIGQPFVVTSAERHLVHELGGRPALERVLAIVEGLDERDRALAARGLHCGVVVDESAAEPDRGDFLVRAVLGADRATGTVAIGTEVAVGTTVQLQVADPAGEDLGGIVQDHDAGGALVFACTGRGSRLFGDAGHDARAVGDHVGGAVAGMACAGEIGPAGRRNALHTFTATVALFPR